METGEQELKKPSVEEWIHYGDVIIRRLTDCVHAYKHPPYEDVFIPDAERQQKTDAVIKLLRRVYALVDELDIPSADAPERDERVISGLAPLFGETRQNLSWLSADMQKLLKSPWMHGFPNKTTQILFIGDGDESEGIGSGYAEHGRLPAILADMQERERAGKTRHAHEVTARHDEPRDKRLALMCLALLNHTEPQRNDPDGDSPLGRAKQPLLAHGRKGGVEFASLRNEEEGVTNVLEKGFFAASFQKLCRRIPERCSRAKNCV